MSPRTIGRAAALLIVAFWGAMMTQLLRREVFLPRLEAAAVRVPSLLKSGGVFSMQEEWQGIYYNDAKVGYVHSIVRELDEGNYVIQNDAHIQLRLLARDLEVHFDGSAFVDPNGTPNKLLYMVQAGPARLRVNGQRDGDRLNLKVISAGRVIEKTVPITPGLTVSNAITPSLYWPEVQHGKTYTLDVLDPLSLSTRPAKVRVVGREMLPFGSGEAETTLLEFEYNSLTFRSWISESGVVLRQESDLGWYLVREDREQATKGLARGRELESVLEDFATVRSYVTFRNSRELSYLRVRLAGIDHAPLDLEGAQQRFVDPHAGVVEIARSNPSAATAPPLPLTGLQFRPHLESSTFVQSDDPAIVSMAHKIVDDETNSWRAARRIGDWVFRNLEKDLLASIPSAIEILETRRGDCNEHTTLFTALARAAGIPTRVAVGIVYNDGRYFYHAWPEVYVGEWVAMDPTFGQDVADATHIRLLEGDLLEQSRLATVLGRLEVQVLASSESAPAAVGAS